MSIYITVRQSPQYHQLTLEELLFQTYSGPLIINSNENNTRTYCVEKLSPRFQRLYDTQKLIAALERFNAETDSLHIDNPHELYTNFYIPKNEGGFRAMFRGMFRSQNRYVPCNAGAVCSSVAQMLSPLIHEHPAIAHEALYQGCRQAVFAVLAGNGFDTDRIDFDALLSDAFRKIDAPIDTLKLALTELKRIFENEFCALYHTGAFAYIKGRCTVDAIKRHQANESRWFAKYDLKNFFGSTAPDFVLKMLSMVFPFSEVVLDPRGKAALVRALELAFLDGGLPQGTPLSPTLTNIMMIPVDYQIANTLRDYNRQRFVYTRYADDFQISSRYDFSYTEIEKLIVDTLSSFGAPFNINSKKTRYGSTAGSNWNLGLMLNQENNITLGWKKRRQLICAIYSYVMDRKRGISWEIHDLQALVGNINYHKMVEGDKIDQLISGLSGKYNVDIRQMIKQDLNR